MKDIVTIKDIKKAEFCTKNKIWSKRPGTGKTLKFLNKFLNKKSKKNIKINTLIKYTDIK